jgi:CheY-like chemotaxis protein
MTPPSPTVAAFERPPAAAPFKQSDVASDASQSAPNGYADVAKVLVDLLRQKDPVADKTSGPKRPVWDRRKALVCTDAVRRKVIAEGLATLDFEIYVADNTAEALGRMREDRMDVLVLESGFDPVEQGFAFVMREIKLMRPAERRRLFFVLITPNARTMDLHAAFLHNANLVVNPADIERMPDALDVSLRHYNELYREFNRALDVAPI